MEEALAKARMAVLLVTSDFLSSKFIYEDEVPRILRRAREEGLKVYPILTKRCDWESQEWLRDIQMRPGGSAPVWRENGIYVDDEMTVITAEIRGIINGAGSGANGAGVKGRDAKDEGANGGASSAAVEGGARRGAAPDGPGGLKLSKRVLSYALLLLLAAGVVYGVARLAGGTGGATGEPARPSPAAFQGQWIGNFADKDSLAAQWEPAPGWVLGPTTVNGAQGLLAKGAGVGLVKLPKEKEGEAFKNYTVEMELVVGEGQRSASWVLRAQDKENYYLFVMTFPHDDQGARLQGALFTGGKQERLLDAATSTIIPYRRPFQPGDELFVTIDVEENNFVHHINVTSVEHLRLLADPNYHIQPQNINQKDTYEIKFFDTGERLKYGPFGLKSDDADLKVKSLKITAKLGGAQRAQL